MACRTRAPSIWRRPPGARAVDFVHQTEAGVKVQARGLSLYATAFHARTQEQNCEATTQRSLFTEAGVGSILVNGIVRARSINGRSIPASFKFDF